jgi:thiol-disulfide isomerase/thioredoxin
MKLAAALLVVIGLGGLVGQASAEPLDTVLARSTTERKAVVLEIGAEWCKPCKEFERSILPDARVKAALKQVIFVRYDADDEQGQEVVRRLKVDGYPTFILLGAKGAELGRQVGTPLGEPGVGQFLDLLRDAGGALDDVVSMAAKLKAHPGDLDLELSAARWYLGRKLPHEALWHYAAVAKSSRATVAQRHDATDAALHLTRTLAWRAQLISDKVSLLRQDPALAAYDDLVVTTVGSTLPPDEAKALVSTVLAAQTDDEQLNSLVYVALAAGANDAALAGIQRVVAHQHVPQFLDTLAEVHHVRGERAKALEVEDEAIELAKGTPLAKALAVNRGRFASSRIDSTEVMTARARADALRARFDSVDELDQVAPPESAKVKDQRARNMKAMEQQLALAKSVGEKCRGVAGTSDYAYANVGVVKERIAGVTLYLDAGAPPALRTCLARELVGQPFLDTSSNNRSMAISLTATR